MPYLGAFPSEAVRARLRALSPSEPYGPTRALRSPQKASDSPRARPQRKPAGRGDTPHTGRPDRLPRYPVSGINRRRAPHRSHRPHPQTGRRDPARSQRKPRRAQGPQGRPQHAPHAGAARVDLRPLAGPHAPKRVPHPPESTRAESSTRRAHRERSAHKLAMHFAPQTSAVPHHTGRGGIVHKRRTERGRFIRRQHARAVQNQETARAPIIGERTPAHRLAPISLGKHRHGIIVRHHREALQNPPPSTMPGGKSAPVR
jgi:hypothetical protein